MTRTIDLDDLDRLTALRDGLPAAVEKIQEALAALAESVRQLHVLAGQRSPSRNGDGADDPDIEAPPRAAPVRTGTLRQRTLDENHVRDEDDIGPGSKSFLDRDDTVHPQQFHDAEAIPGVPKDRYRIENRLAHNPVVLSWGSTGCRDGSTTRQARPKRLRWIRVAQSGPVENYLPIGPHADHWGVTLSIPGYKTEMVTLAELRRLSDWPLKRLRPKGGGERLRPTGGEA